MTEPSNGQTKGAMGERILLAVRDVGEKSRGQGSLIDNVEKAERIVAALVEAGVEPEAVTALRATEVPLTVSYRWVVEIFDKEDPQERTAGAPDATRLGLLHRAAGFLQEIMPEAPFQLRLDRVLWLGLWAASLLILGVSLLTSLSSGSAREFVIGGQPSSLEEQSQPPEIAGDPDPAPDQTSPAAGGVTPLPSCIDGAFNNCQCQHFATQREAQKFFESYPPPDGHTVDPDSDGVICEWLPDSTPRPGQ